LGVVLKYPNLSHLNEIKDYPNAEFSTAAFKAHQKGEKVLIEHVSPKRAFTRAAIAKLDGGLTDRQFLNFVKRNYRLVLLTEKETEKLNKINCSEMTSDRLGQAGIRVYPRHRKSRPPQLYTTAPSTCPKG